MKLTVVNSSSAGNAYVLESNSGEQLCIEAGRPIKEVKEIANLKTSKCVGMVISHAHGDHAKYAKDFLKAGIDVYSTIHLADKTLGVIGMQPEETYHLGEFSVTPLYVKHDVPCLSFLIHHKEIGTLYFFTDCYNMKTAIRGVSTFLCECNYEDGLLIKAVNEGKTIASQADRIRLSHLSEAHAIEFLQDCEAEKSATQIILIHGSARHLNPEQAISKFQRVLGIPTYYAKKGLSIQLIK